MSYLFVNASYFIGPVRHLIAFFATYGKVRNAEAIWQAAYDIIKFRIPEQSDIKQFIAIITPTFSYSARVSINKLLQKLIEARRTV